MSNIWYQNSRRAAVIRLIKADMPLEGIYFWVPTPRGWEVLTWYLETDPQDSEEDKQQKFNRIKHDSVWPEVLAMLHQKYGVPQQLLAPVRNRFDTFPRGRVYRNRIGCGETEQRIIPGSFQKVCQKFQRTPNTMQVVYDGHWDADPNLMVPIIQFMENPELDAGQGQQQVTFRPTVPLEDAYVVRTIEELIQAGPKPGLYDAGMVENLYVDRDLQAYLKEAVPITQLTLGTEPSAQEVEQAKQEIEQQVKKYPIVYRQGQRFLVRLNEARVRAAEQLNIQRLYVWLNVGSFE